MTDPELPAADRAADRTDGSSSYHATRDSSLDAGSGSDPADVRFRKFASGLDGACILCNRRSDTALFVTPSMEHLFGIPPARIERDPSVRFDLVHEEDRDAARSAAEAYRQGSSDATEVTYRLSDVEGAWKTIREKWIPLDEESYCIHLTDRTLEHHWRANRRRLAERERQLDTLLESIPCGVAVIVDGEIVYANAGLTELTGFPQEQIIGRSVADFVSEGDGARATARVRDAIHGDVATWTDYRSHHYDGSELFLATLSKQTEYQGKPAVISILEDNTERKLTEAALRESEERFRFLVETVPNFIMTTDLEYRFTSVNRTHPELTMADVLGTSLFDFIHPDDKDKVVHALDVAEKSFDHYDCEIRAYRTPDVWEWYAVRFGPVVKNGELAGYALVATDITDRKNAEIDLQRSEARNRAFLRANPDLVFRIDRTGRFLDYSCGPGVELALSPNAFLGKLIHEMMPESIASLAMEAIDRVLQHPEDPEIFEYQLGIGPSDRKFEARVARTSPEEAMIFIRDVTELRRLEDAVQETSEAERNRLGENLHDGLGQHLTGIAFRAQVLEGMLEEGDSVFAEEARGVRILVDQAVDQARRLSRELYPLDVQVHGLNHALRSMAAVVEDRCCIPIGVTVCEGCVEDLETATQVFRIAQEAAGNAAQHSKASAIRISLEKAGGWLELEITDDGRGMAIPASSDGMGLEIMKHRARRIGSVLRIESEPGCGTKISCRFQVGSRRVEDRNTEE